MPHARSLARASAIATVVLLALGATPALASGPALTLTSPLAESRIATSHPEVQGTTSDLLDPLVVSFYSGSLAGGTPVCSAEGDVGPGGEWSATCEAGLPDGPYTAVAEQSELGEAGVSEPVSFVLDTIAPAVSLQAPPAETNNPTPTLEGTAGTAPGDVASVAVRVFEGEGTSGKVVAQGTVTPVGESWSYKPPALVDGTYTVQASQLDEAGNEGSSAADVFTLDTVPPAVSLEAPPAETNDDAPLLHGSAGTEAGDVPSVLVRVYAGEGTAGTPISEQAVTPVGGIWSYRPAALADGTYTVQASQRDEAGNEGRSHADTFTVDTVAPAVSLEAPPSDSNDDTPLLHGSAGIALGDLTSVTVTIAEGGSVAGKRVLQKTVTPTGGSWSYTPPALADGTYTVQVSQRDAAGNEGRSEEAVFTVDTVAPVLTMQTPPAYTNKQAVSLSGQLGQAEGDVQAVAVTIYKGTSPSGAEAAKGAAVVSGNSWTFTTTSLPAGTYTAQASQHDEAGNTGLSSHPTFTVDLTAPDVSVTEPSQDAQLEVAKPTFAGVAGTAPGDLPAVRLRIYKDEELLYTVEATAGEGGGWSTGSSGPDLANGIYTVIAEQEDQAGNVGDSKPVLFSVSGLPLVTLFGEGMVRREGAPHPFAGPQPNFSGQGSTAAEDGGEITLKLYEGASTTGQLLRTVTTPLSGGSWSTGLGAPLSDGTYTLRAEQEGPVGQLGFSPPVTFTVDADAPTVTLTAPADGTAVTAEAGLQAGGQAGEAPGDDPEVTVRVYAGASVGGSPVETASGAVSGGSWSARLGALTPGTYTATAEQDDDVGNVGRSAPSTFTVAAPSAGPPPTASFNWFPAEPRVGEAVSLVSTSTDPTSAIVGYAWNLTGSGGLSPGAQTISTSFSTPGAHSVSLQVTDALGATGTVTESIQVAAQPLVLMQPFPVVRIAGSEGTRNVTIRLLTVQAPAGASVTIVCRGRGCPTKRLDTVAPARKSGVASGPVLLTIHRFERRLPVGVVLEIRVGKAGEIGKYTKFVTRRGKLPVRTDSCLAPTGSPMECPST